MFFVLPGLSMYFQMFLLLALLPAIVLMVYIYRLDPIDKEPDGLLWTLIIQGVYAALVSSLLEGVGMNVLGLYTGLDPQSASFEIVSDFLFVGVIEEGSKYWLMSRKTWNNLAFGCRFDGVVYAVFTSLGFAAAENLMYGFMYGPGVLFARAFMAIPAHMGFAVLFGLFYGQAKGMSVRGQKVGAGVLIAVGYVLSVLLHGLYDSAAMVGTNDSDAHFLLVVVVIYLVNFVLTRQAARNDRRFA